MVTRGKVDLHRGGVGPIQLLQLREGRGAKCRQWIGRHAKKYAENVSGKFYCDDQCIDCDLCRETAPANFRRSDDGGYSYVFKQPTTPEEEALCKEAMEGCPVEAIGNNGKG